MTKPTDCNWRARLLSALRTEDGRPDLEAQEAFRQDNDPTEWGKERNWRCVHGHKASYWLVGDLAVIHEPASDPFVVLEAWTA